MCTNSVSCRYVVDECVRQCVQDRSSKSFEVNWIRTLNNAIEKGVCETVNDYHRLFVFVMKCLVYVHDDHK